MQKSVQSTRGLFMSIALVFVCAMLVAAIPIESSLGTVSLEAAAAALPNPDPCDEICWYDVECSLACRDQGINITCGEYGDCVACSAICEPGVSCEYDCLEQGSVMKCGQVPYGCGEPQPQCPDLCEEDPLVYCTAACFVSFNPTSCGEEEYECSTQTEGCSTHDQCRTSAKNYCFQACDAGVCVTGLPCPNDQFCIDRLGGEFTCPGGICMWQYGCGG